jgi:hypothetical protein
VAEEQREEATNPTAAALQRRIAAVARDIANTEQDLAATFVQIAERAPARAEHLNSVAADARAHAKSEREVASHMNDADNPPA